MSGLHTSLQFEEGTKVVHKQDGSLGLFMNVESADLARVLWNGAKESSLVYVGDLDLAQETKNAPVQPLPQFVDPVSNFPAELKDLPRWCVWGRGKRTTTEGKLDKKPYDARSGREANKADSRTDFRTCVAVLSEYHGLGFAPEYEDGYTMWDFDGCVSATHEIDPRVFQIIRETNSYAEFSPSGNGVHIFTKGFQVPDRKGHLVGRAEVYSNGRYFTVTGNQIPGTPNTVQSRDMQKLYERILSGEFVPEDQKKNSGAGAKSSTKDGGLVLEGSRDTWLTSQGGTYRAAGDEYDTVYAKLVLDNQKCVPPKDDADLQRIAKSVCRYPAGAPITVLINGRMPGQGVNVTQTVTQTPEKVVPPSDGHYTEEIAEQEDQAQEEQYQASLLSQEPMPETEEEAQAQLATRPHALLRTPTEGAPYFDADNILYGISGRIIRKIDAESESHPAGNLLEFLVGFGNLIGRGPHFMHESTKHFTNEFGIRVGESALSRKGTGKDRVQELLWKLDHRWMTDCVKGGFGSGQAIIQAVTDEITQIKLVKGKRVVTIVAQDVPDKRLLISQGEFSGVLKMAAMEGSLFSEVFRDAYDCKKLENTVKGTPNKCLEPFISCCCDTNLKDLKSLLQDSPNAGNGFGNRFMFAYVERTKDIPSGGAQLDWNSELGAPEVGDPADQPEWGLEPDQFDGPPNAPVVPAAKKGSLLDIVEHARQRKEVKRSWVAERAWLNMYPSFEQRVRGMNGSAASVVTRAEAHVARISMLYALLDMSEHIEPRHLYAAKALWDYCCDSAEWIFAGRTADLQLIMNRLATREADKKEQTAAQIQNAVFRMGHSKRPRPVTHVEGCCNFLWKHGYLRRLVSETGVYHWTRSGAKRVWRVGGVTNLLAHSQ